MKILLVIVVLVGVLILFILFLSKLIYAIVVNIYFTLIKVAAPVNRKAAAWVKGRKDLFKTLPMHFNFPGSKKIWIHCASLGEFEQARPIIEELKKTHPDAKILLTFFSPSGYEVRKNYELADYVTYLPADSPQNAKKFLDSVQPDIALFIKYEFWVYIVEELHKRKIPTFLVSALFRKKQIFFRWYGGLFRSLLKKYTAIFVQTQESLDLLKNRKITNCELTGDTRFDRVLEVARNPKDFPQLRNFIHEHNIIVAGSTWPADERILKTTYDKYLYSHRYKLIIAPHEIKEKELKKTLKKFNGQAMLFSEMDHKLPEEIASKDILIVDNIGILSSLYRYGNLCYVGGGFGKGLHNILEASVYGKPVFIGPKFKKFKEAVDLTNETSAFSIFDSTGIITGMQFMENFDEIYNNACRIGREYVKDHSGATQKVVENVQTYL